MPVPRTAIAALCAVLLLSSQAEARPSCWSAREQDAAQLRAFRTMLMVGALKCRRQTEVADAYNRFVEEQRGRLQRHDRILERRFEREHGEEARAALDRYNTILANQYSDIFDRAGSCSGLLPVAGDAAAADGDGLLEIARAWTRAPSTTACGFRNRLG